MSVMRKMMLALLFAMPILFLAVSMTGTGVALATGGPGDSLGSVECSEDASGEIDPDNPCDESGGGEPISEPGI